MLRLDDLCLKLWRPKQSEQKNRSQIIDISRSQISHRLLFQMKESLPCTESSEKFHLKSNVASLTSLVWMFQMSRMCSETHGASRCSLDWYGHSKLTQKESIAGSMSISLTTARNNTKIFKMLSSMNLAIRNWFNFFRWLMTQIFRLWMVKLSWRKLLTETRECLARLPMTLG